MEVRQLAALPATVWTRIEVRPTERDELRRERKKLQNLLIPLFQGGLEGRLPEAMPDEDLVNALAQYLEFDPVEKQALLERDGLLNRCRSLIELLEMKVLAARHSWDRDGSH